jgi:MFS family permease
VLADVALANGSSKPDTGIKITSNVLCGNSVKDTVAALGDPAIRGRLIVMACSWFALSFGFYGFSVWGPSYFASRGFQRTGVYQAITLSVVCQLPGTSPLRLSPPPPPPSARHEHFMMTHDNHFSTGTAVAALLVERVGRRLLLIAFSIGCTIAVSGVALFTSNAVSFECNSPPCQCRLVPSSQPSAINHQPSTINHKYYQPSAINHKPSTINTKPGNNKSCRQGMVVSSLFLNFFTAGLWAVTYTHTPEVFPTHVRTTCMGVCSCIARIAGIIVSLMGGFLLSISVEVRLHHMPITSHLPTTCTIPNCLWNAKPHISNVQCACHGHASLHSPAVLAAFFWLKNWLNDAHISDEVNLTRT